MPEGNVTVVLGTQWGDEGKGKLTDILAAEVDMVARYGGAHNAGHTIIKEGFKIAFHMIPSGILIPDTMCVIGNGVLLEPISLVQEIRGIQEKGFPVTPDNLAISDIAHLIFPHHIALDDMRESTGNGHGSTRRGVSFAAGEKYGRDNRQVHKLANFSGIEDHLLDNLEKANAKRRAKGLEPYPPTEWLEKYREAAEFILPYVTDTVDLVHDRLETGARVLAEGSQSHYLDIEQSPYPYGTSAHTAVGGVLTGLSIGPQYINRVIGVMKGFKTRVGDGPIVTEIRNKRLATRVRGKRTDEDGGEFGASTDRPRTPAHLDIPEVRRAIRINGITEINLSKLDKLRTFGDFLKVAIEYELNGSRLDRAPSPTQLADCKPIYERFPLWDESLAGTTQFKDLPHRAQDLVRQLEILLDTHISYVGVGPKDTQLIRR